MLYFQMILSIIIMALGAMWATAPKYVLDKSMRKGSVETGDVAEKDAKMVQRIRIVGVGQFVIGLTWLLVEVFGDINAAYYGYVLSVGLILMGTLMALLPTYGPRVDETEDKKAEKKARTTSFMLIGLGALLLVLELFVFE